MPQLLPLYLKLISGVLLGFILVRLFSENVATFLGKFLFWLGVPLGIIAFLRGAELTQIVWISPVIAWIAMLLGISLAWLWSNKKNWDKPAQGSFILASMLGNTGYLGYPISLAIAGEKYFAWALFYDLLGTTIGAYGLGVFLAAYFGKPPENQWHLFLEVLKNPTLWALGVGLYLRRFSFAPIAELSLKLFAWTVIGIALILIGMRLGKITSWQKISTVSIGLSIKMLLVPVTLGLAISLLGITGSPQLVLVLQMAMPPAFATLVIAEAYNLDREISVTALGFGSIFLLLTLPLWLFLFY